MPTVNIEKFYRRVDILVKKLPRNEFAQDLTSVECAVLMLCGNNSGAPLFNVYVLTHGVTAGM